MEKRFTWLGGMIAVLVLVGILWTVLRPGPAPQKGKQRYRQEPVLLVYDEANGNKRKMRLEDYLEGVVAGEMKKGWPQAAYAAQAIVARTFTLEFIGRGGTRKLHGTDVSTDEKETQAYNPGNITPAVQQAVRSTRGEVITYNNKFIKAWFCSSAGGKTALAREGLAYPGPEPPYIVSVASPDDQYAPPEVRAWKTQVPLSELVGLMQKKFPAVKQIKAVRISARGPSGRATEITVTHTGGALKMKGNDFRLLLGPQRLRSTLLNRLEVVGGKLVIEGKGFGHGVGLSQYGAYTLAKQGKSPQEIIKHYFKDIKIVKLWR